MRALRAFGSSRTATVGLALVGLVVLLAATAPVLGLQDPLEQSPSSRLSAPDLVHLLGRDAFGRDVFARLFYAGRISLVVGPGSVAIGGGLGTLLGLIAGSSGRRGEALLMRTIDVLMSFPSLLFGLLVLAVLGPGLGKMIVAIGIVLAPPFARVVHSTALSLDRRDFVEAARCLGASYPRIVVRHLLPNLLSEVVVLAGVLTASAIRIEASLSFIGLGVSPPTPTWGNMIRDGLPVLLEAPWLSIAPGLAIAVCVLACNLVSDGVRDALDPARGPR